MHKELVAHGKIPAKKMASHFPIAWESADQYRTVPNRRYLLRQQWLFASPGRSGNGVNDRAMERAIVMHGAPYVSQAFSVSMRAYWTQLGMSGRSGGVARTLIDNLKGGQFLFSYYPDQRWLHTSLS